MHRWLALSIKCSYGLMCLCSVLDIDQFKQQNATSTTHLAEKYMYVYRGCILLRGSHCAVRGRGIYLNFKSFLHALTAIDRGQMFSRRVVFVCSSCSVFGVRVGNFSRTVHCVEVGWLDDAVDYSFRVVLLCWRGANIWFGGC